MGTKGAEISGGDNIELKAKNLETIMIDTREAWTIGMAGAWMVDGIEEIRTTAISLSFKKIKTESMGPTWNNTGNQGSEEDTNTTKQGEKGRTERAMQEITTSILLPMTHLT